MFKKIVDLLVHLKIFTHSTNNTVNNTADN